MPTDVLLMAGKKKWGFSRGKKEEQVAGKKMLEKDGREEILVKNGGGVGWKGKESFIFTTGYRCKG